MRYSVKITKYEVKAAGPPPEFAVSTGYPIEDRHVVGTNVNFEILKGAMRIAAGVAVSVGALVILN